MNVKASNLQINTLQQGMKLTVYIDRHEVQDNSNKWSNRFSLESCSMELAEDFIAWLYDQSFQEEVEFILPDSPDLTVI